MGEHTRFGESLDELPHVGSIRDGVVSNFSKVAALMCVETKLVSIGVTGSHGASKAVKLASRSSGVNWPYTSLR